MPTNITNTPIVSNLFIEKTYNLQQGVDWYKAWQAKN
jgi:hypothetical protein